MRTLVRTVALLASTLSLLVVAPTPPSTATGGGTASAGLRAAAPCATGRPQVGVGDTTDRGYHGFDITAMGLWNNPGDACVWTTVAGRFTSAKAQALQVLIDTDGRGGPEFYTFGYSPRDGDDRTGSFLVGRRDGEWTYLDCEVRTFWRPRKDQLGIGVPQWCLGDPRSVRVKVQVWDIREYRPNNTWRGRADQAPNRRWSPAAG
ncbi:hypothetical protein [Nocardioides dongxiaopingii]|uniref:hypothetical protein n=1 Tax=Nocardioides dongxiaopingii TaxID=2576036 RepID=UPI0010C767FF|nr:hypothetical protein [Nocardioides dongxiaopingii]